MFFPICLYLASAAETPQFEKVFSDHGNTAYSSGVMANGEAILREKGSLNHEDGRLVRISLHQPSRRSRVNAGASSVRTDGAQVFISKSGGSSLDRDRPISPNSEFFEDSEGCRVISTANLRAAFGSRWNGKQATSAITTSRGYAAVVNGQLLISHNGEVTVLPNSSGLALSAGPQNTFAAFDGISEITVFNADSAKVVDHIKLLAPLTSFGSIVGGINGCWIVSSQENEIYSVDSAGRVKTIFQGSDGNIQFASIYKNYILIGERPGLVTVLKSTSSTSRHAT